MNPSFSLLPFSSTLILLLVLNFHGVVVNGDLITDVCKNATAKFITLKYDFCVSALESNPKSKTSDLLGLGVISMELCGNYATIVLPHIHKLLDDGKHKERFVKQSLETCLKVYTDAIRLAKEAIAAFNDKDYDSAGVAIVGVDDFSTTCEDTFDQWNLKFPFRKQVDDLQQLVDISYAIITWVE